MTRFKTIIRTALILLSMVAILPVASADKDDPIAKAIKARQAGFQLYSFYAGQLFAMAKGEQDYNAELASAMASNLVSVTQLNNGVMWLPGSDNEARKGDTRALPKIWQEGSDIGDKAKAIAAAAQDVSMVAGDGLDALRGKIGDLGEACKACHDKFRAEDF